MKVFVVTQEWQTREERQHNIMGVFDSHEKAEKKIKELHKDDLEWMNQEYGFPLEELDDNICKEDYSFVSYDEYFSENSIEEEELQ